MIISLFSFGMNWALYTFTFYGLTLIMHQFHSAYSESTFKIAFLIGLVDAIFLKLVRMCSFNVNAILLFVLCAGLNYMLIRGTSGLAQTYYVTGHMAPTIAAIVLAFVMLAFNMFKAKFMSHEWQ
ncbi:MAG TPA: hypothetical protein VGD62_06665 [Acidobacteriaceae bacterium]